ncbi:hypothetical protein DMC25_27080 [Caulobacter sp. D4A]|uniref:hypothetical protein n=1 Tax=unclassified Caulobacter TaxID=2648921 RepID=UPI000D731E74|nr:MULTISPECIES: hypothetical protein [unclassified Caulobacter]PXA70415.1 hypothetical protein DMC25_27080 [Caulobacter sp. D4A]PXA96812.1 hypothetical protein DMC18_00685 [Caulobacter sp. D5]
MTGRASEAALDALHGLLAGALKDELEAAMLASKTENTPINPQLLDKVMKFLAQNGVDTPQAAPRVDALAATLQDIDLEAELTRPRH